MTIAPSTWRIPFNKPHLVGRELTYISDAQKRGKLAGDGYYTQLCRQWLEDSFGLAMALLTHSCTAAIEMMAILSDIEPGDEVIIPDYTFVSTANAFVLRGAVPVFVDIRPDTLNMNEQLIEQAITSRTKAIVPVHYAGVGCEMDVIKQIAKKHTLLILEDAAQGFDATYKHQFLGSIGHMAAFSFHETKNVISGEGGALCLNSERFTLRAQMIREKGTNRIKFIEGKIDKYTWVDIGSSYLPGDIIAAFLMAQLEKSRTITKKRLAIWNRYHKELETLEKKGLIRRPIVPDECQHNGHTYYVLTNDEIEKKSLLEFLKNRGILAVTHYVPLHATPAGKKFGRSAGKICVSRDTEERLIRLPLFYDLTKSEQADVVECLYDFYTHK